MSGNSVKLAFPTAGDVDLEVLHLGVFRNNETHEVSDQQVHQWEVATGREWPGTLELPANLEEIENLEKVADSDDPFPRHKGGGTYVLSDGTAVKGKEAAEQAEADLQNHDEDDNDDTDDQSDGGE